MNTPLIDAAIDRKNQNSGILRWFNDAKETIQLPVLNFAMCYEARKNLGAGLEVLLDEIQTAFYSAQRGGGKEPNWDYVQLLDLTSYLQLNHVPGKIKKLTSKKIAKLNDPHVAMYLEALQEGMILFNAAEAAKSRIVKGRIVDPNKIPDPADLYNTAHCAICDRRQKLNGEVLVHHGFEISGGSGRYYGCRVGSCFGVGYKPYEFGCDANIAYKPILEKALVEAEKHLAHLKSGTITELARPPRWRNDSEVTFHRDVEDEKYEFKRMLEHAVYLAEREVEHLKEGIRRQTEKIEKWVLKPLPPGSVPPSV